MELDCPAGAENNSTYLLRESEEISLNEKPLKRHSLIFMHRISDLEGNLKIMYLGEREDSGVSLASIPQPFNSLEGKQ